jgi:hypothetical protein
MGYAGIWGREKKLEKKLEKSLREECGKGGQRKDATVYIDTVGAAEARAGGVTSPASPKASRVEFYHVTARAIASGEMLSVASRESLCETMVYSDADKGTPANEEHRGGKSR